MLFYALNFINSLKSKAIGKCYKNLTKLVLECVLWNWHLTPVLAHHHVDSTLGQGSIFNACIILVYLPAKEEDVSLNKVYL